MRRRVLGFFLLSGFLSVGHLHADRLVACFHRVDTPRTWTEAQSYCRETFADLATIRDDEDGRAVRALQTTGAFWMGYRQSWRWSQGGRELYLNTSFMKWARGEPSSGDCVTVNTRGWIARNCGDRRLVLCYDAGSQKHVLVDQLMSWSRAKELCNSRYTHLSSILSQNDHDDIISLMQKATGTTGGTTDATGGAILNIVTRDVNQDTTDATGDANDSTGGATQSAGGATDTTQSTTAGTVAAEGTEENNDDITSLSTSSSLPEAWIGLHRGPWVWSDQSSATYSLWAVGQPDPSADCGLMDVSTGRWRSASCSGKHNFICYSAGRHLILTSLKFKLGGGPVDLNDPQTQLTVLQQLEKTLKDRGVREDVTLQWKAWPDGKVFYREEQSAPPAELEDSGV